MQCNPACVLRMASAWLSSPSELASVAMENRRRCLSLLVTPGTACCFLLTLITGSAGVKRMTDSGEQALRMGKWNAGTGDILHQ